MGVVNGSNLDEDWGSHVDERGTAVCGRSKELWFGIVAYCQLLLETHQLFSLIFLGGLL